MLRRSRLLSALAVIALSLGLITACGDDDSGGSGGSGNASGTGASGTGSSQCIGSCTPGDMCTIDPPPGSDAPSVLCICDDDSQWCCGESECYGTGGGGGAGGSSTVGGGGAGGV